MIDALEIVQIEMGEVCHFKFQECNWQKGYLSVDCRRAIYNWLWFYTTWFSAFTLKLPNYSKAIPKCNYRLFLTSNLQDIFSSKILMPVYVFVSFIIQCF